MERSKDYVVESLELHLFFARVMKEHAFFLKVGLMPGNDGLMREGEWLLRQLEGLLSRTILLSDNVVRNKVLCSGEMVTDYTDQAEAQTSQLTGTFLNRSLTARTHQLNGRGCDDDLCENPMQIRQVEQLNQNALMLVERLIRYKEYLLEKIRCCNLFTANYPLLVEHILREAHLYRAHILRLEGKCSHEDSVYCDSEKFWNQIMMEHAQFIRGLLDPSEENLIQTAHEFAKDYRCLLETSRMTNEKMMKTMNVSDLTEKFRDFKAAGTEGIGACKIRSIILPLLADHVLREANHYLRLLED